MQVSQAPPTVETAHHCCPKLCRYMLGGWPYCAAILQGMVGLIQLALMCRFRDPLKTTGDRFVWDYWHVPNQYTLLRTPADQFFPEDTYRRAHT